LAHNQEGTIPIITMLLDMKNEVYVRIEIKEDGLTHLSFCFEES
jgi:hypothetical protein